MTYALPLPAPPEETDDPVERLVRNVRWTERLARWLRLSERPPAAQLEADIVAQLEFFPVPRALDGRQARISDGFHSVADWEAGRARRAHRGVDIEWPRRVAALTAAAKDHPWGSKWFYVPKDPHQRPIVAAAAGRVVICGPRVEGGLMTGQCVILEHARQVGTGYHHLEQIFAKVGDWIEAGQVVGIMGGAPPPAFGLKHLHFDLAYRGHFLDSAPYLALLEHLTLEQAWGRAGRLAAAFTVAEVTGLVS
jgi:murein DD-endopeptidase MepM/ murein hydrolase activator NlpD